MYLYVANHQFGQSQPAELKEFIVEIGKKAAIRVVANKDYVSFAPPVNGVLVDLGFDDSLASVGRSLQDRLQISGFITDPLPQDQLFLYARRLKRIRFSLREGVKGVYYKGFYREWQDSLLLQSTLDLRGLGAFTVKRLKGNIERQIIFQADYEFISKAEDIFLEWLLLLARVDAPLPKLKRSSEPQPKTANQESTANATKPLSGTSKQLPDPLGLLESSIGPESKREKKFDLAIDPALEGLPLGDSILTFLNSGDPRAQNLMEALKKFNSESEKAKSK